MQTLGCFTNLWSELKNSMLKGHDDYPKSLTAAYNLLCNYRAPTSQRTTDSQVNVSFLQATNDQENPTTGNATETQESVPGTNGQCYPRTFCYCCRRHGHIARYRAEPDIRGGVQSMQIGVTLTQVEEITDVSNIIPDEWILLDSGSTVSSVKSKSLLQNVRKVTELMRVYTNGGSQDYHEVLP